MSGSCPKQSSSRIPIAAPGLAVRWPAEQLKPGVLVAAQHARALVIAMGAQPSSAWWLRSWDRLCIPKPFATVDVSYSAPLEIAEGKEGLRRGIVAVEEALREVTHGRETGAGKRQA